VSFDLYQKQCLPSVRSVLSIRLSTTNTHMTSARASQQSDLLRLTTKQNLSRISFLFFLILFIRLPVPTLAETSKKFLKTVAPLLNNDEFNETKKVCLFENRSFFLSKYYFYIDC